MEWHVESCVGCGYCCKKAACMHGAFKHGEAHAPCKSLVFKDGRYWCGLVLEADESRRAFLVRDLAMGDGCSSSMFNTDREEMLRARSIR